MGIFDSIKEGQAFVGQQQREISQAGKGVKGLADKARAYLNNGNLPEFGTTEKGSSASGQRWIGFASNALNGDIERVSVSAISDGFLSWHSMDAKDFNRLYSYEFIIANGDVPAYRMVLPINPQSISINVPNTTATTVTMKGIVEEHNGAPLRQIRISGTSGILPSETYANSATVQSNLLSFLGQDIIKTGLSVVDKVGNVLKAVGGQSQGSDGPLNYTDEMMFGASSKGKATVSLDPPLKSGYYFIHNLARFLDFYIALKKDNANKKYRLVFQMNKDQMYYDVTLNGYSIDKTAGTLEYSYNINLTAWRRRKGSVSQRSPAAARFQPSTVNRLNLLASLIEGVKEARVAIAVIKDLPSAVRSDKERLENAAYEMGAFGAEVLNLPKTAELMWTQIKNTNLTGALVNGFTDANLLAQFNAEQAKKLYQQNPAATEENVGSAAYMGLADSAPRDYESADPAMDLTNNPSDYMSLLVQLPIDSLTLPGETRDALDAEFERIRNLTSDDFKTHRDFVASFSASMAEFFGGGSASYNRVKGLPPPKVSYREPSVDDLVFLNQLNFLISALDAAINLLEGIESDKSAYFNFYRDYAVANGLDFTDAVSKFFVPFPHGASLESLAYAYLDDPNRWIEIAALNGLKAPYIDEDGTETLLISSGVGTSITLPSSDNLYIGQVIEVLSDTRPPTKRHVTSIDVINSVETLLQLDGEPNLSIYKASENARIRSFKPHTVNSSMLVAIPSQSAAQLPNNLKMSPGVEDLNGLAAIADVDFMLQSDGDVVFSSAGDVRLAYGLTNLTQAAILKLKTKQGSLLQHPEFGNPIDVGMSTADITVQDVAEAFDNVFKSDPRFTGIVATKLAKIGPAIEATLMVQVADAGNTFAISTELPK